MIIPFEHLSQDALYGLIEEFITREGTDYGLYEVDLPDKIEQVLQQVRSQEVVIVFDVATESTSLMTQQQYREANSHGGSSAPEQHYV